MKNFEQSFRDVRLRQRNSEPIDWNQARQDFKESAITNVEAAKNHYFIEKVIQGINGDDTAAILDYGCGGGALITRLFFMGYENIQGVDIADNGRNAEFASNIGMGEVFSVYDGKKLPYDDESFDLIISETVLEHVPNIEDYYSEAARVLKPGGVLIAYFPHRLAPFDTHSRTWFIHYFPKPVRRALYSRFAKQTPDYLESMLHLRTRRAHIATALKYFERHEDHCAGRLKNYRYRGAYEGNSRLRNLAGKIMAAPLFGGLAANALSCLADADLHFYKAGKNKRTATSD